MPYLECPGCRLSLYSAAGHSWTADTCAACGASLAGAARRFITEVGARRLWREFLSTPGAVASARHALDGVYTELGDPVNMTTVLLVSELVTNSVKHSNATNGVIELVASITSGTVRVEVRDGGDGFDPPPLAHEEAECGRGLQLVQELVDRWGWSGGAGTTVWFELDRIPARARKAATAAAAAVSAPELTLST